MNKKDLVPVFALVVLLFVWMVVDRTYIAPKFAQEIPPAAQEQDDEGSTIDQATLSATTNIADNADIPPAETPPTAAPKIVEPPVEEQVAILENDEIRLEITSIGGGIKSATMIAANEVGEIRYPEFNEKGSAPVVLNFTNTPALAYDGLPGLGAKAAFHLEQSDDAKGVVLTKSLDDVVFERTISLQDGYLLEINDRFIASADRPAHLPAIRILTGHMQNPPDMKAMKGISILGVDSYTPDGGVNYWGRSLTGFYDPRSFFAKMFKQYTGPDAIDTTPPDMQGQPVDWVAAKNKFFVQVLQHRDREATMAILSSRDTGVDNLVPEDIAAVLAFEPATIEPGQTLETGFTYYVGPKKYALLKAAGNNMEAVMEFKTIGFWSFMNWLMEPARKALLWSLNLFHGLFHNYGVAIILLTLVVRILFWPLTHKSTESMRRMQEIQPQIKALQAKYKKDPQRMQQETMKLYRENKVNPMGGCLPMFVQIPVFIALFTVLRNAIELRYAGFLWIADLSAPENLLAGKMPVVGSLNILPIVMAVSMVFQQKLNSPSTAATPEQQQQQKMMMVMMPIMMLFFFYSMPSGLVLYWTTSNLLMIAQTAIRNLRKKVAEA